MTFAQRALYSKKTTERDNSSINYLSYYKVLNKYYHYYETLTCHVKNQQLKKTRIKRKENLTNPEKKSKR